MDQPNLDQYDLDCLLATQVKSGDFIVNVGRVVGTRPEGAFMHMSVESERWDVARGIQVNVTENMFFHGADELYVVPVYNQPASVRKV
jgi:hypothetical protein